MKRIIIPLFNSIANPVVIHGFMMIEEDVPNRVIHKRLGDALNTPYYRFPEASWEEFWGYVSDINVAIKHKKLVLRYARTNGILTQDMLLSHDLDMILNLWDPSFIAPSKFNNDFRPNQLLETIRGREVDVFNQWIPNNITKGSYEQQSFVLWACSLLDGTLTLLNDDRVLETKFKWFDPLSKTFRLRDIGCSSISLTKEQRYTIQTGDIDMLLDFDGFHLRIMDLILDIGGIPKNRKAMEYLFETQTNITDFSDFKKSVYQAIYSGHFEIIDHPWMQKVQHRNGYAVSPLGINMDKTIAKNRFNTIVQQWEVLIMSHFIIELHQTVPSLQIHQYLYDGLYFSFDLEDTEVVTKFIENRRYNPTDLFKTEKGELNEFPFSVVVSPKKSFTGSMNQ